MDGRHKQSPPAFSCSLCFVLSLLPASSVNRSFLCFLSSSLSFFPCLAAHHQRLLHDARLPLPAPLFAHSFACFRSFGCTIRSKKCIAFKLFFRDSIDDDALTKLHEMNVGVDGEREQRASNKQAAHRSDAVLLI
jgi:hypothetical protein